MQDAEEQIGTALGVVGEHEMPITLEGPVDATDEVELDPAGDVGRGLAL